MGWGEGNKNQGGWCTDEGKEGKILINSQEKRYFFLRQQETTKDQTLER